MLRAHSCLHVHPGMAVTQAHNVSPSLCRFVICYTSPLPKLNDGGTFSIGEYSCSSWRFKQTFGESLPRGFMTNVTCRLTAKDRDQLRNPTVGNRVWATFFYHASLCQCGICCIPESVDLYMYAFSVTNQCWTNVSSRNRCHLHDRLMSSLLIPKCILLKFFVILQCDQPKLAWYRKNCDFR